LSIGKHPASAAANRAAPALLFVRKFIFLPG
jgi:hypothetical protein